MSNKVIFLDRDGTINRDSASYIKNWNEFEFLPGSLEALALLSRHGCALILITNQSSVGRGMVPPTVLEHTHRSMCTAVEAAGGHFLDIFVCPHRPEEACACRKPKPGLILQAQRRYNIDLANSVMIGDSARDILCGQQAGCATTILVRTGNGLSAEQTLAGQNALPDLVTTDLLEAARIILAMNGGRSNG
ncbi:MAG: hypothetical protein VR64_12640 [Desulfatitalea sp. BRH_c12]|nr:MAG: hypothetical protein VR64_12640 [Desulfatitalea sp. BRH_c12]